MWKNLPLPWLHKIKTSSQSIALNYTASGNCQMGLKIMAISSLVAQIFKKKNWREIRLVLCGENIGLGLLIVVFYNTEKYRENIIRSHIWIPRINQYWHFSYLLHIFSKLKNDNFEIDFMLSQVYSLPSSPDATTVSTFVCILSIHVFILYVYIHYIVFYIFINT